MNLTPTEKQAYDMQINEMRQDATANCSNCHHAKPLGLDQYDCPRKADPIKTMQGNPCFKWRGWE